MSVLTSAVSIGDNQLRIDTPLAAGQVPGFVKIDDELLSVGGQDNLVGTTLTLSTPAQAAHSSGATVTYAGRPYDPTFKSALTGNGVQTIRLLGPYRVSYNTPGLNAQPGAGVGPVLAGGTILIRAWAFVTEGWWDADSAILNIRLRSPAADQEFELAEYDSLAARADAEAGPVGRENTPTGGINAVPARSQVGVVLSASDARLYALVVRSGASPDTLGAADIYALIAEPA